MFFGGAAFFVVVLGGKFGRFGLRFFGPRIGPEPNFHLGPELYFQFFCFFFYLKPL